MMRFVLIAATLAAPISSRAGCTDDVSAAYAQARTLPSTPGRAALLEQIQRAEIAHHEGDDAECRSALADATDVLDKVSAAKH